MKKLIATVLVVFGMAFAARSHAQVYGQFTGAETLPVNGHMFGVYLHSTQNVVGILSQLRLSFYPSVDFGFIGGLARQDLAGGDITTVRLGADLKVVARRATPDFPVAFAVGGELGIEAGDNFNLLTLGPSVTASRSFAVGDGSFTPYAKVGLAFSSIDVGRQDDTDVAMPVRLGSAFLIGRQMGLAVELQLQLGDAINDDVGFAGGVNVHF